MTTLRLFPLIALFSVLVAADTALAQTAGPYEPSFALLRDTLYILDTTYLEVRLDEQMIYQHFRNGRVDRHRCSTGDPTIEDGIATREGIFTILSKEKKHMSQQFQVYLNYWMQFDGGIGFHGLEGVSYYKYLGQRRSSHGCVRIANETGAALFKTTARGTLVYVHSGSPARLIRFADEKTQGLTIIGENEYPLLEKRLDAVMKRRWDDPALVPRIAVAPRQRLQAKLGVGRIDARRTIQKPIPLIELAVVPPTPDLRVEPVRELVVAVEKVEEE